MNDFAWAIICILLIGLCGYLWARLQGANAPSVRPSPLPGRKADDGLASLEQAKLRAEEILERADEGVLLLDRELVPVMANRAARNMLGFQDSRLPSRLPSEEVLDAARQATPESDVEEILNVWFPLPMNLSVKAI